MTDLTQHKPHPIEVALLAAMTQEILQGRSRADALSFLRSIAEDGLTTNLPPTSPFYTRLLFYESLLLIDPAYAKLFAGPGSQAEDCEPLQKLPTRRRRAPGKKISPCEKSK
jgi:hypothetical protein